MTRIVLVTGSRFVQLTESDDGWHARSELKDVQPQALALDPQDPNRIYVATAHHGLWKSADAGSHWRDCGLPASDVFSVAVSPVDGALYAGCEPSALFKSMDGGASWQDLEALKSIPSAPTWSFPPRPHTSHVRWIAPNPHDKDLLLVGIELGGVMRSTDGGRTWQDHRPGAKMDAHELAWHPQARGRAYQAAGDGVAWSRDGGQHWQSLSEGKSKRYTWSLALDPDDPDVFFVSAAPSPMAAHYNHGAAHASIYRWRGAGPWEELSQLEKTSNTMPYSLQMHAGWLYAGFTDGEIWRSADHGDAWQQLPLGQAQPKSIIQMLVGD